MRTGLTPALAVRSPSEKEVKCDHPVSLNTPSQSWIPRFLSHWRHKLNWWGKKNKKQSYSLLGVTRGSIWHSAQKRWRLNTHFYMISTEGDEAGDTRESWRSESICRENKAHSEGKPSKCWGEKSNLTSQMECLLNLLDDSLFLRRGRHFHLCVPCPCVLKNMLFCINQSWCKIPSWNQPKLMQNFIKVWYKS